MFNQELYFLYIGDVKEYTCVYSHNNNDNLKEQEQMETLGGEKGRGNDVKELCPILT